MQVPRLVVCHLGGGCSVTAVLDGRSVDTTMGFTPLEGPPMVTRSGTVDPGALIHVLRSGMSLDELDRALEHESGITALGGLDDPLAFDVFTYRVAAAAAAMLPTLGGLDALAFTAGIGENRADVRDAVSGALAFAEPFRVEVVPAHEELDDRAGRAVAWLRRELTRQLLDELRQGARLGDARNAHRPPPCSRSTRVGRPESRSAGSRVMRTSMRSVYCRSSTALPPSSWTEVGPRSSRPACCRPSPFCQDTAYDRSMCGG